MMIGTHNHPEVGECHGTAIGEMLPLAIGSAISPTTITTTVLMLLSPTAMNRTLSLLVGCVVGVGGAVAFFAFLFTLLPTQDSGGLSSVARDYQACGRCVLFGVGGESVASSARDRRAGRATEMDDCS
jgi:hypothetical protein